MKGLWAVAAGSYYKWNSPHAGPNANEMQGLVWWAKDNRALTTTWLLEHPRCGRAYIGSQAAAYAYAAQTLMNLGAVTAVVHRAPRIALVPLPCSETTSPTIDGRWPALRLAEQLALRGGGAVFPCLVHSRATTSARGQGRGKMANILNNLRLVGRPPPDHAVVFVDDVVTFGDNLAAADHTLQWSGPRGAVVIGATNSVTRNAYDSLAVEVRYELRDGAWHVDVPEPQAWPVR